MSKEIVIDLNKKQSAFWNALFDKNGDIADNQYDEFASWGGYGSGKTMVVCLSIHCICSNPKYAGVNVTVIRETYNQLDDTIIYDYNKLCKGVGYRHKEADKEFHYKNGSLVRFRAFDKPEKILGGSMDIIVVSQAEQIPEDLFKELFGRQRGQTVLPKKLLITEGNPCECWAKKRYHDNELLPNIFFVHSTTFDNSDFLNKHNPKYIPNMLANLTEQQVKRQMYGDWSSHDEMVFPTFNETLHLIDPFMPPESYRRATGGDYGYRNPAAFIYGCTDYDGNLIIFDEFYEKEQLPHQLMEAGNKHGRNPVIMDYSIKRPDRDGKSLWDMLYYDKFSNTKGLRLIPSNKDELRNIAVLNSMFRNNRIYIAKNCVNLIREIKGYRWKRIKLGDTENPKEETVDKDNHAIDALLYLIAYLEDLKSRDPSVPKFEDTLKFQLIYGPKKKTIELA